MKCPRCQAEIGSGAAYCSECGAQLQGSGMNYPGTAQAVTNTGILLGAKAREARKAQVVDPDAILSDRAYNGTIFAVLLWGLLINYLLCRYAVRFVLNLSPVVLLIGYLVLAFAGILLSAKSRNPVVSFVGYNMVVIPFGLVICLLVQEYGGINSAVVTYAFLYTMLITAAMTATVLIAPQFFARIGGILLAALIGMVICEVVLLLFHVRQSWMDWLAAGLFSLYIGYDIYRSQQFPKTVDNAVDSALDIYMDIANLFIRILSILGKKDD